MKVRRMPYRKQYNESPWQQGGPPFGMVGGRSGYGFDRFGGGYSMGMGGMANQFAMGMMGSGFGQNVGYGGYGGMSYGMGSMSRRRDNQQAFRNQRKRPIRSHSPVGNQRNKRSNYDMSANQRNRVRGRNRNNKMGGRNNYGRQGRNSSTGRRRRPEGRGKDEDSDLADGELYNPSESIDDFSGYEYDDDDVDDKKEGEKDKDAEGTAEKSKSEDKTEKQDKAEKQEKTEKKEGDGEGKPEAEDKKPDEKNENAGAKAQSVSKEKKSGAPPKKSLICHVCKIIYSNQEKYSNHMNGRDHKEKMETLLVLQREKAQELKARMKASHSRTDSSKGAGRGRKNQNWCNLCECSFVGNYFSHRHTKDHRKRQDEKATHAISEQLKDLMQVEPAAEDVPPPEKTTEETENAEENKGEEKAEEKPVATSAVLLVNGYYCKLCYKFFGGGAPAKIEHCKNERHIENYKRSLARAKKESATKKDKTKEEDKKKEEDKAKDDDKTKDEDKSKEDSADSKVVTEGKSGDKQDAAVKTDGSTESEGKGQPTENDELMDTEETEKETDATQDAVEKTDADSTMDTDDKDQSAKDEEKEDDSEKSSPGIVRRGRSSRGRGRKRT